MEPKYIVAIVALSVFFILFSIFFILLAHKSKTEAKLQAWLNEIYSDKNLIKIDYDSVSEDDEIVTAPKETATESAVETTEEKEDMQTKPTEEYGKLEIEGIEEITGNYEPDKK